MKLPTLYTANKNGTVQHWTIEIKAHQTRTIYGQVGGKTTTSEWYDSIAKNEGRKNEKTASEQAIFEAKVVWQKKVDKGALENVNELAARVGPRKKENCMLAAKWSDIKAKALKTQPTTALLFPLFCQPKLDGMRAIISYENGKVVAVSRNKKAWITIPHILKALEPLFKANPGIVLDGELYNHALKDDFDKIASLIKRTKPSVDDLRASEAQVMFYCYDICDPTSNFAQRSKDLASLFVKFNLGENKSPIVLVETRQVSTETNLDEIYARYLDWGYEGQMVRLNKPYEFERSKSLLKRKEWMDEEFKVLSLGEGNGNKKGQAAHAFLQLPNGETSRTNIKGNAAARTLLLQNASKVVGKYAITQFFNYTPKGGIRFPYIFAIDSPPYLRIRAGKGRDN